MRKKPLILELFTSLAAALCILAAPRIAFALTCQVTNTSDSILVANSLRYCVNRVNTNALYDRIDVANLSYFPRSTLQITRSVTLIMRGAVFAGEPPFSGSSVFQIGAPCATDPCPASITVTFTDMQLYGWGDIGEPNPPRGIAVAPGHTFVLDDGTIGDFVLSSPNAGAAIEADRRTVIRILDATIRDNEAGQGGALAVRSNLVEISRSTFTGNAAPPSFGGAIYYRTPPHPIVGALEIDGGSTFSNNEALRAGAIYLEPTVELDVEDASFVGNRASTAAGNYGGAIVASTSNTLTRAVFSGNVARDGGALRVAGPTTFDDCTLTSNTATGVGGAAMLLSDATVVNSRFVANTAVRGSGIAFQPAVGGLLEVDSSLFHKNKFGGSGNKSGAGIYVASGGSAAVLNSTFAENGGVIAGDEVPRGGAIAFDATAGAMLLELTHTTFARNTAEEGASIWTRAGTTVHNESTIFAYGAGATECQINGNKLDVSSISDDVSCGFGSADSMSSTDARLGPLANNGGPTMSYKPLATSPAIDAGAASVCPADDQRGSARPVGNGCDIGSIETP
jgi:hypothetical protein